MNAQQIQQIATMAAKAGPSAAKLKKATQELEAIFVKDLLAAMRKTAQHTSLGSSLGGDMYQDLFDQAISESASKTGSLGIGQNLFDRMAPAALRAALSSARITGFQPVRTAGILPAEKNASSGPEARNTHCQDGRDTDKP